MASTSQQTTIKETIYTTLKDEICDGKYTPGSQVQEQEIAGRFGSSRSPVREALKQLVADGLLVEYPNRGVFIRKYSEKDIEDIFDLRIILEGYALKKADENMTPGNILTLNNLLTELKEHHENGDVRQYIDRDANLHQKIVSMCRNDLVISTYENLSDMTRQFRIYTFKSEHRFHESYTDHEQIIGYLLEGKPLEAYKVNKEHLLKAKNVILEALNS